MGEVFEARDRVLQRSVAIKVARRTGAEAAERLHHEAQLVASIQHPNICAILDVGLMPDGSPYLVLDKLVGETLASVLLRRKRLAPAQAIALMSQILSGLQAAHAVGIVHRDLKPANVFLIDRPNDIPLVKVLDFGLAKDISGRHRSMTKPGRACGTPAYMSPEQLLMKPLDRRSDIFSLGIILYEMLAGRHPFAAASVAEMTFKIVHEPCPSLGTVRPELSPELVDIVEMALKKLPAERPQSALALQAALATVEDPSDTEVNGPGSFLPRMDSSSTTSNT